MLVDQPTVLIDMPEILLRMKIGNDYTLDELKGIFNKVCNSIKKKQCIHIPPLAA